MKKKDLEATIKEKVSPILEKTIEKNIGVSIPKLESDISDKLSKPHLDIYVPLHLNFKDAKKMFKKEFLRRELRFHLGNISNLAKAINLDRRSVHRAIKNLNIDIDNLRKGSGATIGDYEHMVDKTIRSTLDEYKEIIHPEKMEQMYQQVDALSRNIAKFLPHQDLSWKEAEKEFEKQFISQAIKSNQGNISKAAKKIELRVETLHRKAKKLGLKKK